MQISVALATYNGERYLQELLDSIAKQTRLPDELIAYDDASSDQTMAILEKFSRSVPFSVHIEQNPQNVGSTRNFEKAIRNCSGDVIALCDQDDYWRPEKLALIEETLEANPEKGLVFSDAGLVDDHLHSLNKTMWEHIGLVASLQARIQTPEAFSMLLKRRYVTGATMAFRASFRDGVLPISPHWVHDGWISINIAAHSTFALIPRPLIQYRQHAANQKRPTEQPRFCRRSKTRSSTGKYVPRSMPRPWNAFERLSANSEMVVTRSTLCARCGQQSEIYYIWLFWCLTINLPANNATLFSKHDSKEYS